MRMSEIRSGVLRVFGSTCEIDPACLPSFDQNSAAFSTDRACLQSWKRRQGIDTLFVASNDFARIFERESNRLATGTEVTAFRQNNIPALGLVETLSRGKVREGDLAPVDAFPHGKGSKVGDGAAGDVDGVRVVVTPRNGRILVAGGPDALARLHDAAPDVVQVVDASLDINLGHKAPAASSAGLRISLCIN